MESASIAHLAQAIVSFIENDAFIAKQTTLAQQMNLAQQEAIEFEIQQLMLFQRKNIEKSSQVMAPGNAPLMVVNEERTYTNEILSLRNNLVSLQRDLALLSPVLVVQPFTPFENPVDKRMRNIFIFAFIFFAVSYSTLLIREGWRRI